MPLDKQTIQQTLSKFSRSKTDTGSSEVQIALLTARINMLTKHFTKHKKDNHSKRGLLIMISRRKKLLSYIKKWSPEIYHQTITKLSLRK